MPRYDYRCERCGRVEEFTFRSVAEAEEAPIYCCVPDPTRYCSRPERLCKGLMIRQPSAPTFVLSGLGWTPKHYKGHS